MLAGRVDGEEVVLARSGDAFYAIGAHCTHYYGPLAEGLIAGRTVDVAAFGTSANLEQKRHVAIAVSLRLMRRNP